MGIQWEKYHICIKYGTLRIGKGTVLKNGIQSINDYSDDRTYEIVNAVAAKMKSDLETRDGDRGYLGYNIPYVGKLILVDNNHEFEIKEK